MTENVIAFPFRKSTLLEMLTDDEDASDLATTMEIAKQRCLRRIGD